MKKHSKRLFSQSASPAVIGIVPSVILSFSLANQNEFEQRCKPDLNGFNTKR